MTRTRDDDACPGALTVHQAADGALARIRLPGGMITPAQVEALAATATEYGSATLELTARGNVQIRGITDTAAVAEAVAAAGLLPSPSHERVRNIVASPLSGRVGDFGDVRGLVTELDAALQSEPELARLPGRFWFGLDDGRGDVSGLGADVGAQLAQDDTAELLISGRPTGLRVDAADVVDALIGAAARFVDIRGNAWRAAELADPTTLFDDAQLGSPLPEQTRPPVGWIEQNDGLVALGAAVPLGVVSAELAQYIVAIDRPLVITPWRSLVVFDLEEGPADVVLRVLAPKGLIFDETSPWLDITACTGSPGCERSAADVRSDATRAASEPPTGEHRHYVGCERACGRPSSGEVLVATGSGYRPLTP